MNEEDKNQEIDRKRKHMNTTTNNNNNQDFTFTNTYQEEFEDELELSLSLPRPKSSSLSSSPPSPPPPSPSPLSMQALLAQNPSQLPLQLPPSHPLYTTLMPPLLAPPQRESSTPIISMVYRQESTPTTVPSRPSRARRNPTQAPRDGKSDTVPAPFPWATTHRATVHTIDYLLSKEIVSVTGEVQCKRCEHQYEMEFDLKEKFIKVGSFIADHKNTMRDRAPSVWMNPVLPTCKFCNQENSVKPIIADKKKEINWLFLLLGQMLGCCTLEQLKYFCKHTKNHRTGAKDRVLYLAYLGLCKQLQPDGPFDR
ncbi:hypothetical protein ACB094_07G118800 [Castanea mollissima]